MEHLFTNSEISIVVRLLIAHCIVDFLLQTNKQVENKKRSLLASTAFYWHILLVFIFTWLFLGTAGGWKYAVVITLTHALIDLGKLMATRYMHTSKIAVRDLWLFLIDQLLHVVAIFIVWLWIINGENKAASLFAFTFNDHTLLLRMLGYFFVIGPVRFIIRHVVELWSPDIEQTNDGLKDAGITIGILERILVLTLVYLGQFAAIGFLVTAKSLLRLIDRPMANESPFSSRKHTEYVLIGTFLSFGLAIFTGLAINWILQ